MNEFSKNQFEVEIPEEFKNLKFVFHEDYLEI